MRIRTAQVEAMARERDDAFFLFVARQLRDHPKWRALNESEQRRFVRDQSRAAAQIDLRTYRQVCDYVASRL
jgi:hypothetical protein